MAPQRLANGATHSSPYEKATLRRITGLRVGNPMASRHSLGSPIPFSAPMSERDN
jgi:hypothetical protein